jgi:valyl-tRNA synthetase
MVAAWPQAADLADYADERAERAIEAVCAVVGAVRGARARYGISPKEPLDVVVKTTGANAEALAEALNAAALQVETMARTARFEVSPEAVKPPQSSVTIASSLEIYLVLEGLVDFDAERERLARDRGKKAAELEKLEKKLTNEGFLAKADISVVEKARADAADFGAAIAQIDQQLADLG